MKVRKKNGETVEYVSGDGLDFKYEKKSHKKRNIVIGVIVLLLVIGVALDSPEDDAYDEKSQDTNVTVDKPTDEQTDDIVKEEGIIDRLKAKVALLFDNEDDEPAPYEFLIADDGFTEKQAETAQEVLDNCNIPKLELEKFTSGANGYICAICKVNNVWGVNIAFEGDELYYVEVTGVRGTDKTEYYENMFGKIKSRRVENITSADIYYEGEYLAYFDDEEYEFIPYEKR